MIRKPRSKASDRPPCLSLIRTRYAQLTAAEKRFADFVMHNHEMIYQSITETVESSRVGYGTVMRFCKKLGYSGFQDFKMHLAQGSPTEEQPRKSASKGDVVAAAADESCRDIRSTAQAISRKDLEGAAKLLARARTVLVVGSAGSAVTALEIEYQLTRLGINAVAVADNHMQRVRAATMGAKDVIFVVSSSGSTKDVIEAAKIAGSVGAGIVCLTNHEKSPLARLADFKLVTAMHRDPLSSEIAPKIAADFVLDVLLTLVRRHRRNANGALIDTFEAASERQL